MQKCNRSVALWEFINISPSSTDLPMQVRTVVCPLWVKSRHSAVSEQCPLYPQKRTSELTRGMSALCQQQTFCAAAELALFDHLVGAGEKRRRNQRWVPAKWPITCASDPEATR